MDLYNSDNTAENENIQLHFAKMQLQSERDTFEQQVVIQNGKFENDQVKFDLAKREFELDKNAFEAYVIAEKAKLEHQRRLLDQTMNGGLLSPMFLEEDTSISTPNMTELMMSEAQANNNASVLPQSQLLNGDAKFLSAVCDSVAQYGEQNAKLVDKAARALVKKSKALDRKANEVAARENIIGDFEKKLELLHNEINRRDLKIDQLKHDIAVNETRIEELRDQVTLKDDTISKLQDQVILKDDTIDKLHDQVTSKNATIGKLQHNNDLLCQRLDTIKDSHQKLQVTFKQKIEAAFDANVASYPIFRSPNPQQNWMIITIENLEKIIDINFHPNQSLLDILWSDPYSALSSVLKNDYMMDKIPQKLDGKVKVFVSSKDVLNQEWIQISGDDCLLSPELASRITVKSLFRYNGTGPVYEGLVHNDRCPIPSCRGRQTPYCQYRFDPDDGSLDNNSHTAHSRPHASQAGNYHLKLKWIRV